MGDMIVLQQVLAVLLSGTRTTAYVTIRSRDTNIENELGKITNFHYTVIFGESLQKRAIGKER